MGWGVVQKLPFLRYIICARPLSWKKVDDFFSVVALKTRSKTTKYTSKSISPSKNVLKLTLALPGAHIHFHCKLRLNFFSQPWRCRCTHCTPGYAYDCKVFSVFLQGFLSRARRRWQLFTPQCLATIFSNIEQICDLSSRLLTDLEDACRQSGPYYSQLGQCFLKHVGYYMQLLHTQWYI